MNHIRYAEYCAIHDGSFVFEVPDGHDCWLLLLTRTPALFEAEGTLKQYPANSAILYEPKHRIYYRACGEHYENDWLRFDSDDPAVTGFSLKNTPFSVSDPAYCHNIFELLNWEHSFPSEHSADLITSLICILFQKLGESLAAAESSITCIPHYHELLTLRKSIRNSPQQQWNITEMAASIHLNKGYLQTIYKQAFGISCIEDVIRSRLALAMDQLLYTDRPISEIAPLCGYNNVEHFCRQFKSLMNETPLEYRRGRSV